MSRETIAGIGYKWTGGKELLQLAERRASMPWGERINLVTGGSAEGITLLTEAVRGTPWITKKTGSASRK